MLGIARCSGVVGIVQRTVVQVGDAGDIVVVCAEVVLDGRDLEVKRDETPAAKGGSNGNRTDFAVEGGHAVTSREVNIAVFRCRIKASLAIVLLRIGVLSSSTGTNGLHGV